MIESGEHTVPPSVKEAVELTPFDAEARYPGPQEPVTREEYESAVGIAEAVIHWAEDLCGKNQ
ncbi:MAG: HEPN domain-containing protein [Candidatus Neomarinimicrobiota bacterium]